MLSISKVPQIIKEAKPVEVKGIKFNGIAAFHDDVQGKKRGPTFAFILTLTACVFCISVIWGHMLSDEQMAQIGKVDILLTPVGGLWRSMPPLPGKLRINCPRK